MPAFLVPVDSGQCLIPLEKAIVLIGRQSDCDVSLTHSRKISRKHCCIAQVNTKFVVRDLGSTNGVFVNGKRIDKEATICMGDEIVIGDVRFRMQNEATAIPKSEPSKNKAASDKVAMKADLAVQDQKSADASPSSPPSIRKRSTVVAPPNLNAPMGLPDSDAEFDIESSSKKRGKTRRKDRVDDVVPIDEDEEEDVLKLASDSF